MGINSSGRGCRSRAHWGREMAVYDDLPREIRDKLKIARGNLCAGCVRNSLRRMGLDGEMKSLDIERRFRRERRGRELVYVPEPDLKP